MRVVVLKVCFVGALLVKTLCAEDPVQLETEVAEVGKASVDTKVMVDKMIASRIAEKEGNLELAEEKLEELLALTPESPLVRERLNRVREKLGKPPLSNLPETHADHAGDHEHAVHEEPEPKAHHVPVEEKIAPAEEQKKMTPVAESHPKKESHTPPSGHSDEKEELIHVEKPSSKDHKKDHFAHIEAIVSQGQKDQSKTVHFEDGNPSAAQESFWQATSTSSFDKMFEDLRTNVISLENSHDTLKMDVTLLERENKQVRSDLEEQKKKQTALQDELTKANQALEKTQQEKDQLYEENEKAYNRIDYLKERLRTSLKDNDKLQRQLSVILADSRIYDNITSSVDRLSAMAGRARNQQIEKEVDAEEFFAANDLWKKYQKLAAQSSDEEALEAALFQAAEAGSDDAIMEIVQKREDGKILAYNTRPIFEWLLLAAKYGNTKAMEKLGDLYAKGDRYVSQNPVEAFAWYEVASFRSNMNVVPKLRTLESELIRSGKKNLLTDGRILANEILAYIK